MAKPNLVPQYDIEKDGITQGLLNKFLTCPELTRWWLLRFHPIASVETLPLKFGNVTHDLLDETYTKIAAGKITQLPTARQIKPMIERVNARWAEKHPRPPQAEIVRQAEATAFASAILPFYFARWPGDLRREWIGVEREFAVPYVLPDGRRTILRGKQDAFFHEGRQRVLLETKTKGRVDPIFLEDWLEFDLQAWLYAWATWKQTGIRPTKILYNVIRRPQLRLKKGEKQDEFVQRCINDVEERPEHYFFRIPVKVTKEKMDRFECRLEELVTSFYDWWTGLAPHYKNHNACENFGICQMFEACAGRTGGYITRPSLYMELER